MAWKNRNQRKRKRPDGGGVGCGLKEEAGSVTSNNERVAEKLSQPTADSSAIEATILALPTTAFSSRSLSAEKETDKEEHIYEQHLCRRIRVVQPYPFTFATFAKARWNGRTILDVYCDEFGSYPKLYYQYAFAEGRIVVNGKQVSETYVIKGGDELSHTVHRHEPAVKVCDIISPIIDSQGTEKVKQIIQQSPFIKILYNTNDIIAVDKPPTMPIHPCGGYHFNSLFHILARQDPSLENHLFTVHRLDRLTSGLTLITKSTSAAATYSKSISERTCQKFYLARVKGRFPFNVDRNLQIYGKCENELPFQLGVRSEADANHLNKDNPMGNAALGFYIDQREYDNHNDPTTNKTIDAFLAEENLFNLDHFLFHKPANSEDQKVARTDEKRELCNGPEKIQSANSELQKSYWLYLACPCRVMKHKNGVCEAGDFSTRSVEDCKGVKPAETAFALIGYDNKSDSSLVMAKPLTGRTHQIRLHLQFMGHPIANDPNYGGDMFYADPVGQQACNDAKERLKALDAGQQSVSCETINKHTVIKPENAITTDVPASVEEISQQKANHSSKRSDESLMEFIKRTCVWCARGRGSMDGVPCDTDVDFSQRKEEDRAVAEFLVRSQGLWLHALQYQIEGNSYTTDLPSWAELFIQHRSAPRAEK